jgi:hypothetical protein
MLPELDTYDWREAFEYADPSRCEGATCSEDVFTREGVKRIVAMEEGENDGPNWIGVFELHDGRFAFLTAGCDYTGWDCQAGGQSWVADDLGMLIQFGLDEDSRVRLSMNGVV